MSAGKSKPKGKIDPTKAEAAILLVCHRMHKSPRFGNTILEKVLFYSDRRAYLLKRKPITGLKYVRQHFGPTVSPEQFLSLVRAMEAKGMVKSEKVKFGKKTQHRLIPLAPLDEATARLSGDEINILEKTADELSSHTATSVSDASHKLMAWRIASDREEIPAFTALLSEAPIYQSDVEWAKKQIEHA